MLGANSYTSFGITAPIFSSEEEKKERENLTAQEQEELSRSLYGKLYGNPQDDNNHNLLHQGLLQQMNRALDQISDKESFEQALEICPDQVTDHDKTRFLRRMDGNPQVSWSSIVLFCVPLAFLTAKLIHIQAAAQRLVDYWERRREVFGQDLCYLPFTQDGALHQDMVALSQGVIHILGTDASGRSVTYVDLGSVDWTLVPPESFLRAAWYFYEVGVSQSSDQQSIVLIMYQKHEKLSNFRRKLAKQVVDLEKLYLPIRIKGFHVCHPNRFFGDISAPILKFFMGKRWRLIFQIHRGTEQAVLNKLLEFGIDREIVPRAFGGLNPCDVEAWLEHQRAQHL
eukprot:CAMPEP_0118707174 /NCGR_PEP_ID=MMETSP0800-20121206/21027_1 /TAXON_ID=210618 ORGANISM="Striatella unipunctata, Strain CCMP2910" /NCGR_SAMPLE_ID=MMETSP0800 /ASSEMBLY_ACC=CAM_ASM_000638 /LENGTH=340 /DNA_ID=CAMNT_0006609911 /DNA_START=55 /DNA_END=1079 /DNA_ORIENTATION=+